MLHLDDNLSSDLGWNSNTGDWAYDGTNDRLDLDPVRRDNTAQRLYIDMQDADYLDGSNLSDTAWVARWAVYSGAQNSSGNVPLHMTFSNNLDDSGSTQQTASVGLNMSPSENTTGIDLSITTGNFETSSSPTRITSSVYSQSDGLSTNTTYYIELIRNSNSWTCNVFSSSAYSGTALGTATISKSGLSSLRYMKMINDSEQSGTKTKTGTWIDDIKIYNGETSVSKTANIQTNSIWEESDTGKHYIWSGSAWTEVA